MGLHGCIVTNNLTDEVFLVVKNIAGGITRIDYVRDVIADALHFLIVVFRARTRVFARQVGVFGFL